MKKNSPSEVRPIVKNRMPEIEHVAEMLCDPASYESVIHHSLHDSPMPSLKDLEELMSRLKATLFPGFYGTSRVRLDSMRYHMAANLDSIYRILAEQIRRGGCFACAEYAMDCTLCGETSADLAMQFMLTVPRIRELLAGDVRAAYEGDPAAKSPGETIFCYPSITALTHQRIAHELYKLDVPLIPRIITEMAHSSTGIDIHPGATIGEEFFIDHGTGVVVGETCVIGKHCRLYQGVTLGALSFPKEADGSLVKNILRHPILEDNVTIYAGATVLGRVTIGAGSTIGGNLWITDDVPAKSRLIQQQAAGKNNGAR